MDSPDNEGVNFISEEIKMYPKPLPATQSTIDIQDNDTASIEPDQSEYNNIWPDLEDFIQNSESSLPQIAEKLHISIDDADKKNVVNENDENDVSKIEEDEYIQVENTENTENAENAKKAENVQNIENTENVENTENAYELIPVEATNKSTQIETSYESSQLETTKNPINVETTDEPIHVIERTQTQDSELSDYEDDSQGLNDVIPMDRIIYSNQIRDSLQRQNIYYSDMANLFSTIEFAKVKPESDEEVTTAVNIHPVIRRSLRTKAKTSYNYPRYSYPSSKRSKNRRRKPKTQSISHSTTENEADVDEKTKTSNDNNEDLDIPIHKSTPISSDYEDNHRNNDVHSVNTENNNINERSDTHVKHDLRSRRIVRNDEPDNATFVDDTRTENLKSKSSKSLPKRITKRVNTSKSTPIRKRAGRKLTSARKKNNDPEWRPNEVDYESDSETRKNRKISSNAPKGQRPASKSNVHSKPPSTSKNDVKRVNPPLSTNIAKSRKRALSLAESAPTSVKKRSSSNVTKPSQRKTKQQNKTKPQIADSLVESTKGQRTQKGQSIRGGKSRLTTKNKQQTIPKEPLEDNLMEFENERQVSMDESIIQETSENIFADIPDMNEDGKGSNKQEIQAAPSKPKKITSAKGKRGQGRNRGKGKTRSVNVSSSSTNNSKIIDVESDVTENNLSLSVNESEPLVDEQSEIIETPKNKDKKGKKAKRGSRGKGKAKSIGSNEGEEYEQAIYEQPILPLFDSNVVALSAENPMALQKAVQVLANENYDILETSRTSVDLSPKDEITSVFTKPINRISRSTSFTNATLPELQPSSSTTLWTNDHWYQLKNLYEETKNRFVRDGKNGVGNEEVYREVIAKFFAKDDNNKIFGEIIALEAAEQERQSGNTPRRGSIGSNNSKGSRISVARYNTAYYNLHDTPYSKRRHDELNLETEDEEELIHPVQRLRRSVSLSGSGTMTPQLDITSVSNSSTISRFFRGLFSRDSSSHTAPVSEIDGPGPMNIDGEENEDEIVLSPTPVRSRSWLWG
ncbi:11998_t:CDS:2 [Diversispora eburnea]|uniref:11998_t:CDS:1 n=1 Tax=Diversispora eburnea TaxID=1213867 RepID=A0A9N9EYD4_9GLOM|nr:11998_t:CDS:2 [Diversispora eburnea]